jgi:putative DNA primase/helicase
MSDQPESLPPWSPEASRALDGEEAEAAAPVAPAEEEHNFSDLGNAKRLAAMFNGNYRFSTHIGWLAWDGKRWARDSEIAVERVAHTLGPLLYKETANQTGEANRKEMAKHASYSESSRGITGMLSLVKARPEVSIDVQQLDNSPYLLNVQNGTVSLLTGEFKKHDKEDYITKLSPVKHDPDAKCPNWDKFQEEIMPDAEVRAYKQKVFAYSLMGDPVERKFFVAVGKGANGKTTEHKLIEYIAGDYGRTTDFDTFTAKPTGGATPELAALQGARFVAAGEAEPGARFSSSLLKKLTGQDTIQARALYKAPFEYQPQFVIWMATNHLPQVNDNSEGFWDRCTPIEYTVRIDPDKRDVHLIERLRQEASGILSWLVEGGIAYSKSALNPIPKAISDATNDYREDEDTLRPFVLACFDEAPGYYVTREEVKIAYADYCKSNGERPLAPKTLTRGLRTNGWVTRRSGDNRRWEGWKLKPEISRKLFQTEPHDY